MALYDLTADQVAEIRALLTADQRRVPSPELVASLDNPATIEVGVFVLGGVVQGARASHPMSFELADQDDLHECSFTEDPDDVPLSCECDPEDVLPTDLADHINTIERCRAVKAMPIAIF